LTLVQALNAEPVKITTLDDRKLTITMDEIISPQTVKVVKAEGMPIFDKANPLNNVLFKEKKGDLYIKFDIYFPKFIDPEKKEEIIRLLEDK
jgi:DnaJ-class molecular chaperone